MKKIINLFSLLILFATVVLPLNVIALDDDEEEDVPVIDFADMPTAGENIPYLEDNEYIEITDQYWVNRMEYKKMEASEKFEENKMYTYVIQYLSKTDTDINWFFDSEDYSVNGATFFDYDNYSIVVIDFYFGDMEDLDSWEAEAATLDIDAPQLGGHPVYARTNSKYTIESQKWIDITDNREMTSTDVFQNNKYYKYEIEYTSYYDTFNFLDNFNESAYHLGDNSIKKSNFSVILSGSFYFGDKSDLKVETGDIIIEESNPPTIGGVLTQPTISGNLAIIAEIYGGWEVLDEDEFYNVPAGTIVEEGKTYNYKLNITLQPGYSFDEGFEIIDRNINSNQVDSGQSISDFEGSIYYYSTFMALDDETSIRIYGTTHFIYPNDMVTLKALPAVEENQNVTWESSNNSIATIDEYGVVTGVSTGEATITATNSKGGTATYEIEVGKRAEAIVLEKEEIDMHVGEEISLSATVLPEDASDKTVLYEVNYDDEEYEEYNPASVYITDNIVYGAEEGVAKIKVTTPSNDELLEEIIVNVEETDVPVENIELNKTELTLEEGESEALIVEYTPEDTIERTITWESDNEDIAIVNENGLVIGISEVITTITAIAKNDLVRTCEVTVTAKEVEIIPVEEIQLNKEELTLTESESVDLIATINPDNATDKTLRWESTNEEVATVDNNGNVTAISEGTTTITVTASNGVEATCVVTVIEKEPEIIPVESIRLSSTTLSLIEGADTQLIATITPDNATDKTLRWESTNEEVATVDNNGNVTAISEGTTTITVTASNGVEATCVVTVIAKEPEIIPVESIRLSSTTLSLIEGTDTQLIATINPNNATDKTLRWESANEEVATVDNNGNVTAISEGTTTITVTASNGVEAICTITVISESEVIEVESISLNKTELVLEEGMSDFLEVIYEPSNATPLSTTWESSNNSVAIADASGEITAVGVGTATITVRTANGKVATCTVTVVPYEEEVAEIELNKTTLTLEEGENETLVVNIIPEDATDKTLRWESSNESIATVDSNGKVTAVSAGTATITVTASNGVEATCTVTVREKEVIIIPVEEIELNKVELSLEAGENEKLVATINPEDATDKTLNWKSSNESVATVDSNGKVTAVSAGTATITVTASNGVEATCIVTVTPKVIPVEKVEIDYTSLVLVEGEIANLSAKVIPSNATDSEIVWTNSNPSVATFENNKVTAVSAGTTVITATAANGMKATCEVTVESEGIPVEEITPNKTSVTLDTGANETLIVTITPEDATHTTLTWESSNEAVATVDENGKVTAVGVGTAIITVSAVNGVKATYEITVNEDPENPVLKSISFNKDVFTLKEGTTKMLDYTLTPANAKNVELEWTSSNRNVVRFNDKGEARAVGVGTAEVTVKTNNNKVATCTVKVVAQSSGDDSDIPSAGFTDVSPKAWYYNYVNKAYQRGIISGYNKTKFGPTDKITRGQLMSIIWRAEGKPVAFGTSKFTDVKADEYYATAIKWAAANDIVHGYENTKKFGPNNPIIRQDLAVVLRNYAAYKGFETDANIDLSSFVDYNKIKGGYAESALKWAVKNKVINGRGLTNGKRAIDPFSNTTRAEAAAMIINFLDEFGIE